MRRIQQQIEREARRLILAQERRHRLHAEEQARLRKRSTSPYSLPPSRTPGWWDLDRGFNPYVVRSRSDYISRSVQKKLESLTFVPRRPVVRWIPKESGGERSVNVYQVADSAVSKMVFESLLRKNLPLISARSYAYRKDLTSQDAVRYIHSAFRGRKRLYVAEYDFSKYFDNIAHKHLHEVLNDLFVTRVERAIIDAFLTTPAAAMDSYQASGGTQRSVGIPQGTSISLFLANVAAWKLDRELEDHGVGFVRYADDTLIWSTDYGRLVAAADILQAHADEMCVPINFGKSKGIRLLVADQVRSEFVHTHSVNYLGYRIGLSSTGLKEDNEKKIKQRIQTLIFETLLREPLNGTQDFSRLTSRLDRDYVVVISRLKRYLYGDLSEREVRRYELKGAPVRRFKGVMAAFPLVDDDRAMQALDAWLITQLWLALRKRGDLLSAPHGFSRHELARFRARSGSTGTTIDLRVPSVRRISRVVQPDAARVL